MNVQQNRTLKGRPTEEECNARDSLQRLFKESPIPKEHLFENLGLFIRRQTWGRLLFIHDLYKKIINVNGVVMEFGVLWGQNMALFSSFRGMYEPFNFSRKIIGFDTFSGFPKVHSKDGKSSVVAEGSYSTTEGYENYLTELLECHEAYSPISHIKKFEIIKVDAIVTLPKYLEENPETIIALAYFDLDLYEPTKKCLEVIKGRLAKGSIIAFDELNHPDFPGETLAFEEVLKFSNYHIIRTPYDPYMSYVIYDGDV